ncbi:MAG: Mpv17/PMP22 family protein [Planctomycetota bacterium]
MNERDAVVTASEAPWRAGVRAAWANRWPGFALVCFAVGLLLAYWYVPAVRDTLDVVAGWKQRVGLVFGIVSTAVFGGLLPWLVQRLVRPGTRDAGWPVLWFLLGFWAVKGLEVDLLYWAQAMVFGDRASPGVVAVKVFFDQGVYVPVWAIPTTVAAFAWRDCGYSLARLRREFFRGGWVGWYRDRVVPVLIANWMVWVPAVVVIYLLPLALQLPIQNLVLCFWSLMLIIQTRGASAGGNLPGVEPRRRGGHGDQSGESVERRVG